MAWFRCLVHGENFPFLMDGAWKLMGFYATRYVEAPSADAAEKAALELLKGEEALKCDADTPGLQNARVFFEEIEQVAKARPHGGFTFYAEEA